MSSQIIECVPNFSEGRRSEVVDEIVAAIQSVKGVVLLDRSSDHDHNRSVITLVGWPEAVVEAAFQGIAKAARLIDLNVHKGEHPRLGATDVVPFVPIQNASLQDCVELARVLGKRVGTELGIPVYLYEAAATRPERVNLEEVRRGEFEALKTAIGTDPQRAPDFGPAVVGPAGATIIGARAPLIAFNVYLTTDDVDVARKIAAAVRHSSGGFRFVKAMGIPVAGRAQVSMNLTDFRKTPIARVVETIRREAARYGVGVHHSELVGLVPQNALIESACWYLQLDQFQPDQVLEARLSQQGSILRADTGEMAFLERLAANTATPGGGSAGAFAGAMGAALAAMVARLTTGKKKYAAVAARMVDLAAEAEHRRKLLADAVVRDAQAFEAVMAAFRLGQDDDESKRLRARAIEEATIGAAEVPLEVAQWTVETMELLAEAAETGNVNAITDAASGMAMSRAAFTAAELNVKANAASINDREMAAGWGARLEAFEVRAAAAEARLRQAVRERTGAA